MKELTKKDLLNSLLRGRANQKKEVNKCCRTISYDVVIKYYINGDISTFLKIAGLGE